MLRTFGFNHRDPDVKRVPNPVGCKCLYCEEDIAADDVGYIDAGMSITHYACFMRMIIGSLAHIEHRCSCFISGSDEGDDPGQTKRQAAEAAVRKWEEITYGVSRPFKSNGSGDVSSGEEHRPEADVP